MPTRKHSKATHDAFLAALVALELRTARAVSAETRQGLVALYEATGGPNWAIKNGWLQGEPCSGSTASWNGLVDSSGENNACNSDGSIGGLCV